jgi:hypothetical protein
MLARQTFVAILISFCYNYAETKTVENITVGLMGMFKPGYGPPFWLAYSGAAALVARDEWSALPSSLVRLNFLYSETFCDPRRALAGLERMVREDGLDGVVGTTCSGATISISYLSSAWNMPVVGFTTTATELSDKRFHDTYIRTVPPSEMMGPVLYNILAYHNWTTVSVGYVFQGGGFVYIAKVFRFYSGTRNVKVNDEEVFMEMPSTPPHPRFCKRIMRRFSRQARGMYEILLFISMWDSDGDRCTTTVFIKRVYGLAVSEVA